ncbi:MAG: hypothetical protein IIA88_09985 [Bacteroidetes bacterium]|nr:hypothetical protein [Bacteroidota bacterium]
MNFTDGQTIQFEGEVEELRSTIEGGFPKVKVKGAHYTSQLLDITITEEFTAAKISDIRISLISNLSGFTSTNVEENTTTIDIKFVNNMIILISIGV